MPAWFYILRPKSGNLYPGSTRNLERRIEQHWNGNGGRTTLHDPPVSVALVEAYENVFEARKRELQIKHWTRAKKEALVGGNLGLLKKLARRRRT